MKSLAKNWKTTSAGILSLVVCLLSLAGVSLAGVTVDPASAVTMIITGGGLIFAKDGNVTGETTPQ
jgi:hypothetical protein